MLKRFVSFPLAPFRWVWRFGLGGKSRGERFVRRGWLAVFLLIFVGLPLLWLFLFGRFHLVQPANSFDWVAQVNSRAKQIPPQDRAWPLYEAGVKLLSRTAYATGVDPDTGQTYFIPSQDLRGHFEFATDATRGWNRRVAEENSLAISRFIEASGNPQLGCDFSDRLEDRVDSSLHPLFWPMPPEDHRKNDAESR